MHIARNLHDEHHCHTKKNDKVPKLLKLNNINVLNVSKKKDSSPPNSKGKGKAFVATTSSSEEWILDSGATHHIGSSKK